MKCIFCLELRTYVCLVVFAAKTIHAGCLMLRIEGERHILNEVHRADCVTVTVRFVHTAAQHSTIWPVKLLRMWRDNDELCCNIQCTLSCSPIRRERKTLKSLITYVHCHILPSSNYFFSLWGSCTTVRSST